MVVPLIASALLLDFLGCMMPLAWVEDTKAFKVGVFLIWAALVADSVLMGLFYPRELAGVNPLLAAGLESICLCFATLIFRFSRLIFFGFHVLRQGRAADFPNFQTCPS